jgi:hypothetical protein
MSSQVTHTMFNPFDGAAFLTGTIHTTWALIDDSPVTWQQTAGPGTVSESFALTGDISPPQITSSQRYFVLLRRY